MSSKVFFKTLIYETFRIMSIGKIDYCQVDDDIQKIEFTVYNDFYKVTLNLNSANCIYTVNVNFIHDNKTENVLSTYICSDITLVSILQLIKTIIQYDSDVR